ncbi:MAG: glycosyltransferase family 2 protein, partial [Bryobacteraceae bacterium]|nr:glycosyltransferase family 2 protein [Bryobacteraceae bacterium]
MSRIAAIILTKNEEADLPACLKSLEAVADEIYVVDSGSTDRTVEIARGFGASVLEHEFVNYAAQLNWALDAVRTQAEWIFRIDADERVSDALARSLRQILPSLTPEVTGVEIACRVSFLGRPLRWGDT